MKKGLHIGYLLSWTLLMSAYSDVRADILDHWTTNQIATNGFGFHHIVYGNGIYVAVGEAGDSGGFYTSSDGFNWALQYSEPNSWGVNLKYSNGRFGCVGPGLGSGVADISANGTNWSTIFGLTSPQDITYGYDYNANGVYVVVGANYIKTSPDGSSWTQNTISPSAAGPIVSVAADEYGDFIAMGNNDGYVYYNGSVGNSSWIRDTISGGNKVSYANGLFFVPLNNGTNLIFYDGVWTAKATGLTNKMGAVTYSHGMFMAQCGISSSGSYLATSPDGTNWFQYPKLLPNACGIYDTSDFDLSVATDGYRLVTGSSVQTNSGLPNRFNSFVYTSDPLVGIRLTNTPVMNIALSGLVGRKYQVQSIDALGVGNTWRTNAILQLTNTPFVWTDNTATNSARFYRGVLLP